MVWAGGQVVITGGTLSLTRTVYVVLIAVPQFVTPTRTRYCLVIVRFAKGSVFVVFVMVVLVTNPSVLLIHARTSPEYPDRVSVPELLPGQCGPTTDELIVPPTGAAWTVPTV